MRLNGVHFVEVQRQQPVVGNRFKLGVVDLQIHGLRFNEHLLWGCWKSKFGPSAGSTLFPVGDEGSFNEVVVERAGQPVHVAIGRKAVENVREVRRDARSTVVWKKGEETVRRCLSRVVGHAGLEPDRDHGIGNLCKRFGGEKHRIGEAVFNDGICKQIVNPRSNDRRKGFTVDEVAADGANR